MTVIRPPEGSSPRMRGAQYIKRTPNRITGIIPAYAGSTRTAIRASSPLKDHPRVCGEHREHGGELLSPSGSSPRMRGAPGSRPRGTSRPGIIPAYAGSTPGCHTAGAGPRDHPRVCGEHVRGLSWGCIISGSSPRMRGALVKGFCCF